MRHLFSGFIALVTCAIAQPAFAQRSTPPSADSDEIVIEGVNQRQREVRRFVDALTDTPINGQIARFDWAVCPGAAGLPEAQNREVVERLRRVAEAAGVTVARRGCRPNALVIVTPDKARTLRWLRRNHPEYFRNMLGDPVRLPDENELATAWQVEGRLNQDGLPIGVESGGGDVPMGRLGNYFIVEATRVASRITPITRPHFVASLVVIELDALRGLTTTQLADYAAMRVLAQTQPSRLERSNAPTILNVIGAPMGAEVPITLTQWDIGFLRALYGSEENRYATQQRREIGRLLRRDLDSGGNQDAN